MRPGFDDYVFDGATREFIHGGAALHLRVKTSPTSKFTDAFGVLIAVEEEP